MYRLPQKLAAEFVGTLLLVFITAGAICADQYLRPAAPLAAADLVAIALAYGLAVMAAVAALVHISGAQLNPAISLGLWVTRRQSTIQTLLYWVAQLAGGIAAAYLLSVAMPESAWMPAGLGTPNLIGDVTRWHGMLLEGILAFFWAISYFGVVVDAKNVSARMAGSAVGFSVAMGALVGLPFTGAALDPARVLGPALVTHHWANHGVYWVGPLLGGIIGAAVYDALFLRNQPPA